MNKKLKLTLVIATLCVICEKLKKCTQLTDPAGSETDKPEPEKTPVDNCEQEIFGTCISTPASPFTAGPEAEEVEPEDEKDESENREPVESALDGLKLADAEADIAGTYMLKSRRRGAVIIKLNDDRTGKMSIGEDEGFIMYNPEERTMIIAQTLYKYDVADDTLLLFKNDKSLTFEKVKE